MTTTRTLSLVSNNVDTLSSIQLIEADDALESSADLQKDESANEAVSVVDVKAKKVKVKKVYDKRLDGYLTKASWNKARLSYKAQQKARATSDKWEAITGEEISPSFWGCTDDSVRFDRQTKAAKMDLNQDYSNNSLIPLYQAIPSSLLLYRLLGLYKAQVLSLGPDGYKSIWCIKIRHKETGAVLSFGEHKAGARFSMEMHQEKASAKLTKDLLELLSLLAGDKCPHPYDGVVSGSVA